MPSNRRYRNPAQLRFSGGVTNARSAAANRAMSTMPLFTIDHLLLGLMLIVITSTNMPVTGSAGYCRFRGFWERRRISPMGWDSRLADGCSPRPAPNANAMGEAHAFDSHPQTLNIATAHNGTMMTT